MKNQRFINTISIKRLAFALGGTSALLYVGCVFVMMTVPQPAVIAFFNSMVHGWDVEPITRWDMPWWEAAVGVAEVFILGWLIGAVVAVLYNVSADHGEGQYAR